jgi:hypothetical protein
MEDSTEPLELSKLGERGERIAALLRAGKHIAVKDENGAVMAWLVPGNRAHLEPADASGSPFERLVAAGQVRRATGNILDHLEPEPAGPGEERLGEAFLRMRDEERF